MVGLCRNREANAGLLLGGATDAEDPIEARLWRPSATRHLPTPGAFSESAVKRIKDPSADPSETLSTS